MPVNARMLELLRLFEEVGIGEQADADAAARMLHLTDMDQWVAPATTITDAVVAGPHGGVPVRVYTPHGTPTTALLWMHGGGFVGGTIDMPEAHVVSAELAVRAGAVVVSVDYRLANEEVRFPIPLDDVSAAWEWLTHDPAFAGIRRRAIGGASAGAALALAAAIRGRDEGDPADAVLVAYPFMHFPVPALAAETVAEMAEVPEFGHFGPASIEGMVGTYVGRITDLPPLALPGAARLDGLPPTAIVVCEYDGLRPSAELLERQLTSVGVPVASYLARGTVHGVLNRAPVEPEVIASIDFLADVLRRA